MTANVVRFRCRTRWVRRRFWLWQQVLSSRTRKRILLAALVLMLLGNIWALFGRWPDLAIQPIEIPHLKL